MSEVPKRNEGDPLDQTTLEIPPERQTRGLTGCSISHYRVLEKLGEGGMGIVYRAEDTRLGRSIAMKFLRAQDWDNEHCRARFLNEARLAASLNHPNICTIHEIDEDQLFLVMELVEGRSLKQKIAEGPLNLDEALEIAIQTARGLHEAHEKGIVHRDVKPGNLMLTPKAQVKILDFGLARLAEATRVTCAGTFLGTPAYMSPEQVEGQDADWRTDIWSLGVVLYEMLTGRLPFAGRTATAVGRAILDDQPEPVTSLQSGIPPELDRILTKALAKNPAERYQHLDELVVDLDLVLNPAGPLETSPLRTQAPPAKSALSYAAT